MKLEESLDRSGKAVFIERDIYYFTDPELIYACGALQKLDYVVTCICQAGNAVAEIGLFPVNIEKSSLLIILPEHIFRWKTFSADFRGIFIMMSRHFIENLNIPEGLSVFMSIRDRFYFPLSPQSEDSIQTFCKLLSGALGNLDPMLNRRAIASHLIIAYFYGLGYYMHKWEGRVEKNRGKIIFEKFLHDVRKHCGTERSLSFYADKQFITPKYLSTSIKRASGKTAGEWIDSYVILEAKNLLRSSDLSILQISDRLNFPSQSFFGKFFKRHTGLSPKDYRMHGA